MNPLVAASYLFKVRSRNIVDYGDYSVELTLSLTMKTSHALSVLSGGGIVESLGAVTNSVTVQAVDEDGNDRTEGGDIFFLLVEQLCYITDNFRCDLSLNQDAVVGIPIVKQLIDNNDGTYYVDYTIQEAGTVTVSVVLMRKGGLYAEYFNNAFLDGVPVITQVDSFLSYDWDEGLITEEAGDFVSIHWYGKLRPPHSEDYTLIFTGDDGFRFYFENELSIDRWDTCCDDMTVRLSLEADTFYDFVLEFREFQEVASFSVEWLSPQISRQVIQPVYLWYSQRVGDVTYEVEVQPGPSIGGKSTVEFYETEFIAGKLYMMTMQSRDT